MMIFVTAGTQLPFDRLMKAVDEMVADLKDTTIVVQAKNAVYKPKNFKILHFLAPTEFDICINEADLIISHAGMGTIITALVKKKPIIVVPRLVKFQEHRNEHQLGTCKQMDALAYVHVAYDEQQLKQIFTEMWPDNLKIRNSISNEASERFIKSVNEFIKF